MNKKIKSALSNPYYGCELVLNQIARFVSDEHFVKWKYFLNFHKKLNLENPQTYNEKLQWLKLYDRREEYTQMVDKYEAKKYVANLIGEEYIIPTLGVYNSFDEIDFDKLPNQFVLKCTHNSGGIIICRDKATLDISKARKQMTKWLKKNPYWSNREFPYKNVTPRVIVETLMEQGNGEPLRDYKFLCFHGKVKLIELHRNRNLDNYTQDFYDENWNKTSFAQVGDPISKDFFPKPENFDLMKRFSELLTRKMKHCRVDWYEIDHRLFFGEITFYDASGLIPFENEKDNLMIGSWIDINN